MRKVLLVTALSASALAACGERSIHFSKRTETSDGKALKVVTQLECPDHQGALTRVRTAPDGLSCDYAGPRGAEVTLRLVKLAAGASAETALTSVEKELNGLMPAVAPKIAKGEADAKAAEASAREAEAIADREEAIADAQADADADGDRAGKSHDRADVDMPGLKVKTDGDKAVVRMPGIHVDASDDGARVSIGGIHIDAKDKSGDVQIQSDDDAVSVKARNDAAEIRTRDKGQGVRLTYILVDETPSQSGWRLVGYEARGPAGGPLVVAVVRSKDRHEQKVFESAKKLVTRNVGG